MSTVLASPSQLLTAEEYRRLPDTGQRTELRRGVVIAMNMPGFRHGKVCARITTRVGGFVDEHDLGHIVSNDSGIVTERDPDTVRGADVAYYSYQRVPKDQSPVGYPGMAPEVVFEVVSPFNPRMEVTRKTGEYLQAGVNVVCVVDPQFSAVNLHYPDRPARELRGDDPLTFAELPGFSLPVRKLFE
jgi:Uma2 family endonuclease